jgi:multicomponent K+:H+ antiporter subunit A
MNHATFKASLFMAAGIIDHETGTREMRRLSGLFRFMPITATLAMVAAAAMAGVPLLNGFLSKEMFLAEAIAQSAGTHINWALPTLATLASAFSVLYSLRFIHQTFFGPPATDLPRTPHEPPRWMIAPIAILVLICLVVGVIPAWTIGPFLETAVRSVLGDQTPEYNLAVWHGFSPPLYLSLLALAAGVALYRVFRDRINTNPLGAPPLLSRFNGRKLFDSTIGGVTSAARLLDSRLAPRRLQTQLRILLLTTLLAAWLIAIGRGVDLSAANINLTRVDPAFALLWLIACACAIGAAHQAKFHRLVAVCLMSGAGLVSCILGLRWLPKRLEDKRGYTSLSLMRARLRRGLDLAIAIAAGIGAAALALAIMTKPAPDSISDFFLEKAYTDAGGRNVVNVLLVDFRAFDTLGEITVLGVVGLTVFALLRRFRPAADSLALPEQQVRQNVFDSRHASREVGDTLIDYLMIPRIIMQWLFAAIIVMAIYLFLRGHDMPGGGFIAGITMAIAFILQYMASGTTWVEARLRILPLRWIGIGLLVSVLCGAGSWIFGYPFLTSSFAYVDIPVLGRLPLASALIFDLGVFVLVVGATVLMLIALGHQSIRKPRVVPPGQQGLPTDIDASPAPEPLAAAREAAEGVL